MLSMYEALPKHHRVSNEAVLHRIFCSFNFAGKAFEETGSEVLAYTRKYDSRHSKGGTAATIPKLLKTTKIVS